MTREMVNQIVCDVFDKRKRAANYKSIKGNCYSIQNDLLKKMGLSSAAGFKRSHRPCFTLLESIWIWWWVRKL